MINRRRSGVRGTPAKVNANAGLAASDKVNSASVSDGSHESVYLCPFYVLTPTWRLQKPKSSSGTPIAVLAYLPATTIPHRQPADIAATRSTRAQEWSPTTSRYAMSATAIDPSRHSSVRPNKRPKNPRLDSVGPGPASSPITRA